MKLEMLSLVLRLGSLSCVLTVFSTILVGRRCWEGWVLAAANSLIICVIGLRTAQLGFIPANLFLYCALCLQPPDLAQGRDPLTSVPEDAGAEIRYLESHGYPIACVEIG
jgi:hypothetical protein